MTKLTNANAIATVIEMVNALETENVGAFGKAEMLEKLDKIKASFEKKSSGGERKPTARQIENDGIKAQVLEILGSATDLMTITDIIKAVGIEEMSNQRMSAIVRQMYLTDGTVVRVEDKRKAYFKIA